jgi:hypothetical protein
VSSCPDNPLPLLPKVILTSPHLSRQQRFFSPGWMLSFSASPRDAATPTLPQLNLHNTRVRRKASGFPSSRCIERAQSHRARVHALPTRASVAKNQRANRKNETKKEHRHRSTRLQLAKDATNCPAISIHKAFKFDRSAFSNDGNPLRAFGERPY